MDFIFRQIHPQNHPMTTDLLQTNQNKILQSQTLLKIVPRQLIMQRLFRPQMMGIQLLKENIDYLMM